MAIKYIPRSSFFSLKIICASVTLLLSQSLLSKGFRRFSFKKYAIMSEFSTIKNDLVIDAFCIRQFNNPDYTGYLK